MTTVNFRALLRAEREKLKRAVKTEKEAGKESDTTLNSGTRPTLGAGERDASTAHDRAYEAVMRASLDSAQFKLLDMQEYALDGPPAGVSYVPEWIDAVTEARIMHLTYQIPAAHPHWVQVRGRRLQCFGGKPADAYTSEPLPPWLSQLCKGLVTTGVFPADLTPNHVLLNEYNKGDGIMPHTDGPFYTPLVAILSLRSPVMLHFWKRKPPELIGVDQEDGSPVASLVLRPRSLLVFSHEAYTDYLHGIEGVEAEQVGAKARVMNLEVRHAGTEFTKQYVVTMIGA